MKKILTSLLVILMVFSMAGCGEKPGGEDENKYDVVFLADVGTIYDGGFNQFSYKGIENYCEKSGAKVLTCNQLLTMMSQERLSLNKQLTK